MQEQIQFLIRLQQIDKDIQQAILDSEENPKKIKQIEMEIQEVQESFEAFLQKIEELKKQRKGLEKEVEEIESKIKKSQLKLMEVKNNKEYKAMLTEIEELKKTKGTSEDQLIEVLENIEDKSLKSKELKNGLEARMGSGKLKKEQLEGKCRNNLEELSKLDLQRHELIPQIDPTLIKQYEFLKEKLKGIAVVEVKELSCLGCHMHIPPQLFNELHRQDRIITCPSCLRIIYLPR